MLGLVIGLAVLWIILAIVGFLAHAVAWLAIVGITLFVVTVAGGAIHAMVTK